MTTYYVSYEGTKPVHTNAKTLAGAKRLASQFCIYQGVSLYVHEKGEYGDFVTVAAKYADPLNMNKVQPWQDL